MEYITKGKAIVVLKTVPNGSYYRVETENDGESICNITTRNHERSHGNANLIADAVNTHNATGYTPSELKQQRDELLEALTKGRDMCDMLRFPTEEELKSFSKMTTELIQKLSNDNT